MLDIKRLKQLFTAQMGSLRSAAVIAVIFFLIMEEVHAQGPAWSVNPGAYQYTMSIVAFLNVDGRLLENERDKVAAFVGSEVRGVTSPIFVSSAGRHLAYLTVFANMQGETVSFKLFDSETGKIANVDTVISFDIDGQYGNTFQAFSIANPALSREAEFKNFSFADTDSVSTSIIPGEIDLILKYDQDLTTLTPEFVTSAGARVFIDRTLQESATQTLDFTEPVIYTVLSEDESVRNTYVVTATNQQSVSESFACTNVITPNNDRANDTWVVQDVFKYERCDFRILDANGRIIFESRGYSNDWDGTVNGSKVARGKYYYVIRNPETDEIFSGDILVLY